MWNISQRKCGSSLCREIDFHKSLRTKTACSRMWISKSLRRRRNQAKEQWDTTLTGRAGDAESMDLRSNCTCADTRLAQTWVSSQSTATGALEMITRTKIIIPLTRREWEPTTETSTTRRMQKNMRRCRRCLLTAKESAGGSKRQKTNTPTTRSCSDRMCSIWRSWNILSQRRISKS